MTVILLFSSSADVQAEKDKSPGHIYNFKSNSMKTYESKRRYLLQKLHTSPYQFDGNGFFHMNYATLVAVGIMKENLQAH